MSPSPERSNNSEAILAAFLTLVVFVYAHGAGFTSQYIVNDDVRQQLFWMQQWEDPELYQYDLLTEYSKRYVPFGVKALYRLASPIFDPLTFSKILTGIEFTALGALFYMFAAGMGGRVTGWACVGFFWLTPIFLHNMSGGLARSFAGPLLMLMLVCWQRGAGLGMGVTLLLQALFIPYIFALSAASVGLAWLSEKGGKFPGPPYPRKLGHYILLGASFGLCLWFNHQISQAGFGPMATAEEMAGRAEFTAAGRFPIVPIPPVWFELLYRPLDRIALFREFGLGVGGVVTVLLAVVGAIGYRRLDGELKESFKKSFPPLAWLALGSVVMWMFARVTLLKLFIPSRYLEYSVAIFYCLLGGLFFVSAFQLFRRPRWLLLGLLTAALCFGAIRLQGEALTDYSEAKALYEALQQTPKDSRIAGHPYTMDNALTFGKRSVYASYELAHPWSRGFWLRVEPRLSQMLAAYYSADAAEFSEFCRLHHIDYFVVDTRHFKPERLAAPKKYSPFYKAQAFPTWAKDVCQWLQLEFLDPPRSVKWPFFEPFGTEVADTIQERETFVAATGAGFPFQRIGPYLLLDVRSPVQ